jgi:hypothetical protein
MVARGHRQNRNERVDRQLQRCRRIDSILRGRQHHDQRLPHPLRIGLAGRDTGPAEQHGRTGQDALTLTIADCNDAIITNPPVTRGLPHRLITPGRTDMVANRLRLGGDQASGAVRASLLGHRDYPA